MHSLASWYKQHERSLKEGMREWTEAEGSVESENVVLSLIICGERSSKIAHFAGNICVNLKDTNACAHERTIRLDTH